MNQETMFFAARKFLEGLVFSSLVFVCFLHFLTWPAYFALGGLVAIFLAFREFKDAPSVGYLIVAALNTALWPAMIYNNVTRQNAQ